MDTTATTAALAEAGAEATCTSNSRIEHTTCVCQYVHAVGARAGRVHGSRAESAPVECRDDMPQGWPPLRACENEIRARPARALNPATPSTRLRAGPSVRGADRWRREMCVLLTFLRSSCSPALVAPPSFRSSSHRRPSRCRPPHRCSCCRSHPHRFSLRGCRRIVPRSSLHSLAVGCAPPLIVVPSLLSGAVLDGTAIPRTCQRFLKPAMLLETGTSTLTGCWRCSA